MRSGLTSIFRVVLAISSFLMLSAGLSACFPRSCSSQFQPSPGPATENQPATDLTILSIIGGDVFVLRPGAADWIKGTEGMTLDEGCKVRTDAGGSATVTLFDGSTIELESDTAISLRDLGKSGTAVHIRIAQEIGKTISRVKKLIDPASRYEIETPAAVAAVRGTSLYVKVAPDGATTVGNVQGAVSVVAQGVEVKLPEGTRTAVLPGKLPGPPEPDPEYSPTPAPTPVTASLTVNLSTDRQTAFPGDNVNCTYSVTNPGSSPLSGVAVVSDRTGSAVLSGGDVNTNNRLDPGETWIFSGGYVVKAEEIGLLTNTVTVSAIGASGQPARASASAGINVLEIIVRITSLQPGAVVTRTVSVSGTVNDPSITKAVITLNGGGAREIPVTNGQFTTSVSLADGVNLIKVTVNKAGISASSESQLAPTTSPR